MKNRLIFFFKLLIALFLVVTVSIVGFSAFKANSILRDAWITDPLLPINWSGYSQDFQIVAISEFEQKNLRASFSRITLQRYLKEERTNQLEWHLLGFITNLYCYFAVSDEEALEKFLKYSYLGSNITGFQDASKYYFDKPIKELDLSDSALLFAISIAPGRFNPFKSIEYAKKGRSLVLERLRHKGLSLEKINMALNKPISLANSKR